MGYSYSPQSTDERARQFFSKRGKHLAIVIVVAFLFVVFYTTGIAMTTYATYSRTVEQQLNETRVNLANVQTEKNLCQASLENTSNDLKLCQTNVNSITALLDSCDKEKTLLYTNVNSLNSSLNNCKTEKAAAAQSFKQFIKNSVKAICCSYGDVQSGAARKWSMVNDSIICTGEYTVDCATGETNY
ncbi:MAG: hypothetical protein WC613_03440 [Candidatus Aenigmatarchaeota archaeon]